MRSLGTQQIHTPNEQRIGCGPSSEPGRSPWVVLAIMAFILLVVLSTACRRQPSGPRAFVEGYLAAAASRDFDHLIACYGPEKKEEFETIRRVDPGAFDKWKETWLDSLQAGFARAKLGEVVQDKAEPEKFRVVVQNVESEWGLKGNVVIMNLEIVVERSKGRWVYVEALPAPVSQK